MGVDKQPRAALAPQYAFVVQLATDTQIEVGRMHGRVEHVVSRQATHFTSLETLLTFIAQVLRGVAAREQEAASERPPEGQGAHDTDVRG
ncbi:MAG: hypothetical protein AB7N91_26640 [Candidatus Tectimicrobiota bacterium]